MTKMQPKATTFFFRFLFWFLCYVPALENFTRGCRPAKIRALEERANCPFSSWFDRGENIRSDALFSWMVSIMKSWNRWDPCRGVICFSLMANAQGLCCCEYHPRVSEHFTSATFLFVERCTWYGQNACLEKTNISRLAFVSPYPNQ